MSYFNKANSYAALKEHEKAVQDYNESLKRISHHFAYFNRGNSFYCLGKYQEAIGCYKKCIEKSEKNSGAWFNKGNAEIMLSAFEEAKKSYCEALKTDPNNKNCNDNYESVQSILKGPEEGETYKFSGNQGNAGMFQGMHSLEEPASLQGGSEGFKGGDGFALEYHNGRFIPV